MKCPPPPIRAPVSTADTTVLPATGTNTTAANEATFLMDNMIPQAPNNNEYTWANLEEYGRSLVTAGNEIYVVMGSYGSGGTGSSGTATSVNGGKVAVPSNHRRPAEGE